MIARLGHLCGWAGNGLAALTMLVAVWGYNQQPIPFSHAHRPYDPLIWGMVVAFVFWLIGRALRYLFAGGTHDDATKE
jgi:hypothetical protein